MTSVRLRTVLVASAFSAALGGACAAERDADSRAPITSGIVDSALPIETLLSRFRATIPDTPSTLSGGAADPQALARALLAALTRHDTAALRSLVVNRAEFAWLYYPHTRYTRPPYELGPELAWFQQMAASEKGVARLVDRYGGSRLRFDGLQCADRVIGEGPNRIIGNCRVRFAAADSAARELQLFAGLLSRDGRYKFLSYANDL